MYVKVNLHRTHKQESRDSHPLLERGALLEEQRQGNDENNEIQNHVDSSVALVCSNELRRRRRAISVAFCVWRGFPEALDWKTRKPGYKRIGKAPQSSEYSNTECKPPNDMASSIDTEILKE